jgi:carbamoyl-phosphate synthase large subunit
VVGLMNVQFAIQGGEIYVLEVNPRASRTVPFVAKATGVPIAKIAARVMAGEKLRSFRLGKLAKRDHVAVKEAVFPFSRFPGVDIILGPEMKSTGEVMGLDTDFAHAFAKAQLGAGVKLPNEGTVFISVRDTDKQAIAPLARRLAGLGFNVMATGGTAKFLAAQGIAVEHVQKVQEGPPHCVDAINEGRIHLVINTTAGAQAIADSFSIRRSALVLNLPHYTTVSGASAAVAAIESLRQRGLEVAPLQSYSK